MTSKSCSIDVFLLPENTRSVDLSQQVVVLIDVLRATSTIVTAIDNGAASVIPCADVDETRRTAAELPGSLLCGERGGVRIDGFDLGNSPGEYTAEMVAGKTVVLTTTNGTAALKHLTSARRVLIGAFVNSTAIAAALKGCDRIAIVCAGTDGFVTGEDTMAAGAIASRIVQGMPAAIQNDQCQLAITAWQAVGGADHDTAALAKALLNTHGGLNLAGIGMADDIDFCATIDRCQVVPELDLQSNRIGAARR